MNSRRIVIPAHYAPGPLPPGAPAPKPEGVLTLLTRCGAAFGVEDLAGEIDESQLPIPVSRLDLIFSEAEQSAKVLEYLANLLVGQEERFIPQVDVFCGIPGGGLALAYALAQYSNCRYKFLERNIAGGLQFDRHKVKTESVVLVKDVVMGNDSDIHEAVRVVERTDGAVLGIFCVYNVHGEKAFHGVPITSLIKWEKDK
jgi:adenine/guanine phosphoribosyltransferase-like PRPP-binding protein